MSGSAPLAATVALSGDGQILVVGDRVIAPRFSRDWEGTVVALEGAVARVVWDEMSGKPLAIAPEIEVELLARLGGPILIGDFVRVVGPVTQAGASEPVTVNWAAALVVGRFGSESVYLAPLHRTTLYESTLSSVTRISRAQVWS